ncbi:unnamed protein product [Cylindrotheca closterium]|uniref:Uncharacterized protein n=1 Tax=Cylindrotheca closterium TaxID=2856 RepID=A0AAD2GA15_9STRA|nr:unnamed protein product [Cylindrotheca closterium]
MSEAEQPVKRKSVADMWREREQAVLEKQQQPYKPTASPARRSFKNVEEKKIEGAGVATTNNSSSNAATSATSKTASNNSGGEASTTRRPVSTKSKFAMMGQKHAARPKKLPTYQKYQQPAKKSDPKSPDSTNSDALLGDAFDDAVSEKEGKKLSTELSSRRRFPQSAGNATRPSEYSSLQVSDSASIPKDVHPKLSTDNNDDEQSNISGLSSPGSPARSARNQRRSKAIPESPEHDKGMDQSFDSGAYSTGMSTATNRSSPGRDAVSEVVADGFVQESDNQVSAFQDAMQKMSLEDIANDIKEEATAVFGGVGESMAAASQKFSSLFAKKEEAPAQAEKSVEAGESPTEGDAAATETPAENSEEPENVESKPENVKEEPAAESIEVAEAAEPVTEDVEPVAEVAEPVEPAEPVVTEAPQTATKEVSTEKNDKGADAPDPPLEAADSSEVFDPFASNEPADFADFAAFPADAFSNDFAAPAPLVPKKELSQQRKPPSSPPRKAPLAQEEVAIEVEYLDDDSDDDQADV